MKKALVSLCMLIITAISFSQTMPTQAEMDKMMKQVQDVMKDLPPEAKQMMDSMGMKMPDSKKLALPKGITMDNIQKKMDQMTADDAAYRKKALAEMPKKMLTDDALFIFLQNSFIKIDAKTSAKAKAHAQRIIAESKAKNVSIENSAIAALMAQGSEEALWILAKLATENPKDANLLSNYSALLKMCDAPHLAIPVLYKLNNKYPNNSTVLNNLGQAWYDLEKRDSAEKYLKLAIKNFPDHSTSNYTEGKICEEKGDTALALAYYRKSLRFGCSTKTIREIEDISKKKISHKDIEWPFADDPDPLGFEKITIPEYPMDVQSAEILEPNMKAFTSYWKAEAEKYYIKMKELGEIVQKKQQAQFAKAVQTKDASQYDLPFAEKAGIFYGQEAIAGFQLSGKAFSDFFEYQEEEKKFQKAKEEKEVALDVLMEKTYEGKCPGEGCPYSRYCPDYARRQDDISNTYLAQVNPKYDYVLNETLKGARQTFNVNVKIALYASPIDEQFELAKITAKYGYAHALSDIKYSFIRPTPKDCGMLTDKDGNYIGEMGDEDCDDKVSVGFGIGKVSLSCTSFTIEGGEIVQGSFEKNFRTGEFEIGFGAGVAFPIGTGPLRAEAGIKVMEIYHFNGSGKLTDVGVKSSAGAEARLGAANIGGEKSVTVMINSGIKVGRERSLGVKF